MQWDAFPIPCRQREVLFPRRQAPTIVSSTDSQQSPPVDLHCHSVASKGGNDPPEKIARYFAEHGYAAFSITDHADWRSIEPARAAAEWLDIEFIPGVEVACRIEDTALVPPGTDRESAEVHILGYDFTPTPLLERLVNTEYDRNREWLRNGFDRLRDRYSLEFDIEHLWDVTEALYGPDVRFKSPLDCPYLLGVALKEAGLLHDNEPPHRGARRLLDEVYPREELPPLPPAGPVCEAIQAAGGLSILAHPGKWVGPVPGTPEREWLDRWLRTRVDGLEVYHPKNNPKHRQLMEELVAERGRPKTGGSDCHNFGVDDATTDASLDCIESLRSYDPAA